MPRTIKIHNRPRPVATEQELLDFANAIRQAGGAGVIEALLPSVPERPDSCLIANALNFGCRVDWGGGTFKDGSRKWVMHLPHDLSERQLKALGKVKGVRLCTVTDGYIGSYSLTLPKHIGNAALAFDSGAAFQQYKKAA